MSDPKIKITKSNDHWSIRAGGAVLGETHDALVLEEADHDPVVYFPRNDIAMAFLDPSDKSTHCPHKGDASYYSIVTKSTTLTDCVWSYENPIAAAEGIKGYLAFAPIDEIKVAQI